MPLVCFGSLINYIHLNERLTTNTTRTRIGFTIEYVLCGLSSCVPELVLNNASTNYIPSVTQK